MKKFVRELEFAQIFSNKKIDDNLVKIFKKAYSINNSLFKRSPEKFKIIVCDTEKEFKKEAKYYYQKWGTATVLRNKTLVTRSPDFVKKIGKWKKKNFPNIMTHEVNHVFWYDTYKKWTPNWLVGGLACHIGNNLILSKNELKKIIKRYNMDHSILNYRYLKRNFKRGHYPRYPIWANFTRYIVKKYSINKLIKLMNEYIKNPRKKHYQKVFKNIFGLTDKELFKKFLNSI